MSLLLFLGVGLPLPHDADEGISLWVQVGGWGDSQLPGNASVDLQLLPGLACLEFLGLAAGFVFQMWKQFKFCFHNPQQFASEVHVLI